MRHIKLRRSSLIESKMLHLDFFILIIQCVSVLSLKWFNDETYKYCIVNGDAPGIIVFEPSLGRDSSFVGIVSGYLDNTTVVLDFTENNNYMSWNILCSTENSSRVLNHPVLDQRWETFLNNHDHDRMLKKIFDENQTTLIFLSVRITDHESALVQHKWYHLMLNGSKLYSCNNESMNMSCNKEVQDDDRTVEFFRKRDRAIWKLHKYKYLYTTNLNIEQIYTKSQNCTSIRIGCFSIYLAMCSNCILTLYLSPTSTERSDYKIFKNIIGNGMWIQKQFVIENFTDCFRISAATDIRDDIDTKNDLFWAVGEFGSLSTRLDCKQNKRYIRTVKKDYDENNSICENALNIKLNFIDELPDANKLLSSLIADVNITSCSTTNQTPSLDDLNTNINFTDKLPDVTDINNISSITDISSASSSTTDQPPLSDSSAFSFLYLIIIIVLLIAVAALSIYLFIFKKRRNTGNEERRKLGNVHKKADTKESTETLELLKYVNTKNVNKPSTAVKRTDFADYVERLCDRLCNDLEDQFSSLLTYYVDEYTEGVNTSNIAKNKIPHICPYDKNRVKLKNKICEKMPATDYINASYIQGLHSHKEYIVTQNPLENTVTDFWHMIWQEKVDHIIMVTRSNESFYRYWPHKREIALEYNGIEINLCDSHNNGSYIHSILRLERQQVIRYVNHLHCHSWNISETSTPDTFLSLMKHLLTIPHLSAPIVFHCFAGQGSSGTLVLCDIALRSLPLTQTIDIYAITEALRKCRINMVPDLEHYRLAHLILDEFFKHE